MADSQHDHAAAERLRQQEDVRAAFQFTATTKDAARPVPNLRARVGLGLYLVLFVALLAAYSLLVLGDVPLPARALSLVRQITLGGLLIVAVLAVTHFLQMYVAESIVNTASRLNLTRLLRLAAALAIGVIVLSLASNGWYTTGVALGLFVVVMGFALRAPITSFLGWLYIVGRQPYRVGDRIAIGGATGDVIDIDYLDTTLWEFHGPYLSTDHPSGRIIRLPNSRVLSTEVYNYSWPLFPYVWQEVKFHVSYESDLAFVAEVMQSVVQEELGQAMPERVRAYRELLAQTPVDELEIQEQPAVHFRVSSNAWLEVIVRYVVAPKEAGRVKTRLIRKLLARLNEAPDRVQFPQGTLR